LTDYDIDTLQLSPPQLMSFADAEAFTPIFSFQLTAIFRQPMLRCSCSRSAADCHGHGWLAVMMLTP